MTATAEAPTRTIPAPPRPSWRLVGLAVALFAAGALYLWTGVAVRQSLLLLLGGLLGLVLYHGY